MYGLYDLRARQACVNAHGRCTGIYSLVVLFYENYRLALQKEISVSSPCEPERWSVAFQLCLVCIKSSITGQWTCFSYARAVAPLASRLRQHAAEAWLPDTVTASRQGMLQ